MLATAEPGIVLVREWLNCVKSEEFDLLEIFSDKKQDISDNAQDICDKKQENCDNGVFQGEVLDPGFPLVSVTTASKIREEDGYYELELKDGVKYIGCIKEELGDGEGELQIPADWTGHWTTGESILRGWFKKGRLEGRVRAESFQDCTTTELLFRNGIPHGPYRRFRRDGQLVQYGFHKNGIKVGKHLKVGTGNNSYYLGNLDSMERLVGQVVFLYPNLQKTILGEYVDGKMISGVYSDLRDAYMGDEVGFPTLVFSSERRDKLKFDPSTFMRISRTPLQRDEYESGTVYVKQSRIPFAGEGLYASRYIEEGQLVCLFNGNRITKTSNRKCVKWGDEDWSDFRLTLDKSTDLDIPGEYQETRTYSATLGHKACHSFGREKNAMFHEFEHPRFGSIMSVVAVKPIYKDEEILVSYNYNICHAPPWYQEQWVQHLVNRGLTRERILAAREKEEQKNSLIIPDHVFKNIPY
ncbi:histone-lysine N-methyltransferase SETD7 [Eurytemora carolleeae]|uniref:histone-lysine N-methyltransferase SETD7 n=1 Tax=Eurytemora carolleeae TaxID=1294199 RepID=UPI000C7789EF|nr:histone-lysine N-methyltransferase SETD7 [Eurytemora carolleeae]|eukprot:XP_023325419.1 histone-lysine N-methyltransferase SETD7-like [Eurytemora affinis]